MPFLITYWKPLLLAVAIIGGLVWINYNWETSAGIKRGSAETQAKWDAANAKQRKEEAEKSAKAATSLEKGNASAKVIYRSITQNVDKYIDRPIYRNMCFDDSGLLDVNAALVGSITASGKPNGTMPKPDTTK